MIYTLGNARTKTVGSPAFIAPNAAIIGDVVLNDACSVWFNATLRADVAGIVLGKRSNVQDNAVIHVDFGLPTTIGDDVTIGHLAMLHGCNISSNVLVGMSATILNGAEIGENCIIGAGALVTEGKRIPPNSVVLGSPGRVVRQVNDKDLEHIRHGASIYVELSERFSKELFQDSGIQ